MVLFDFGIVVLLYVFIGIVFYVVVVMELGVLIVDFFWVCVWSVFDGFWVDFDMVVLMWGGVMGEVIVCVFGVWFVVFDFEFFVLVLWVVFLMICLVFMVFGVFGGVLWVMLFGMSGIFFMFVILVFWLFGGVLCLLVGLLCIGFVVGFCVFCVVDEVEGGVSVWCVVDWMFCSFLFVDVMVVVVIVFVVEMDLLYIVVYGRYVVDNLLFFGFEFVDGIFFGYDVDFILCVLVMVILLVCEFGCLFVCWGEEVLGMMCVWLYVGVECVIVVFVVVFDDVVGEFFVVVYIGFVEGVVLVVVFVKVVVDMGFSVFFQCYGDGL